MVDEWSSEQFRRSVWMKKIPWIKCSHGNFYSLQLCCMKRLPPKLTGNTCIHTSQLICVERHTVNSNNTKVTNDTRERTKEERSKLRDLGGAIPSIFGVEYLKNEVKKVLKSNWKLESLVIFTYITNKKINEKLGFWYQRGILFRLNHRLVLLSWCNIFNIWSARPDQGHRKNCHLICFFYMAIISVPNILQNDLLEMPLSLLILVFLKFTFGLFYYNMTKQYNYYYKRYAILDELCSYKYLFTIYSLHLIVCKYFLFSSCFIEIFCYKVSNSFYYNEVSYWTLLKKIFISF